MVLFRSLLKNKNPYLITGAIIVGIAAFISVFPLERANSLAVDQICGDVEIVYARGSGQAIGVGESVRFREQLIARISPPVRVNFYELGTEAYDNYKYPAINIDEWWKNGNAVGAALSAGSANDYGESVEQGVKELRAYLTQRNSRCPNSRIILGGYSQGAQVVGQALFSLSSSIQHRIDFVALFGDPKLYLPEGEGYYPPACRGIDFSDWRRAIGSCELHSGALTARRPYLPEAMENKAGLWCNRSDFVCGTSKNVWSSEGHEKYKDSGGAIDQAAHEAAYRLKVVLPVDKAMAINAGKDKPGMGTTGEDVLFVLNYTGWTQEEFNKTKEFINSTARRLSAQNVRIGLAVFDGGADWAYVSSSGVPTTDSSVITRSVDEFPFQPPTSSIKPVLRALILSMESFRWTQGATKSIVLLSNTDFYNPDIFDTFDTVAKKALEIDPVNIFPVVSGSFGTFYEEIAKSTSGRTIPHDNYNDITQVVDETVDAIALRPTALLKNTEYSAQVGEEVLYDASDSYVAGGQIIKYEWDFDGNGEFEETTLSPRVSHVYTSPFKGHVQVRLIDSNNISANASAVVKIGMNAAPITPKAPRDLTLEVVSTKGNISVVDMAWQKDSTVPVESWVISMNDVVLGKVAGDRSSMQITDVNRENNVEMSVMGITSEGVIGEKAFAILEKVNSPPPEEKHSFWNLILYVLNTLRKLFGS